MSPIMSPVDISLIITGIENLVSFLLQLKANNQLSDAQLAAAIQTSNEQTRQMIAAFLASQGAAIPTPPGTSAAEPPASGLPPAAPAAA